jgi:hypothetical protein
MKKKAAAPRAKAKRGPGPAGGTKFTLLLSGDEARQLRELANDSGESASVLLRKVIREMHRKNFDFVME